MGWGYARRHTRLPDGEDTVIDRPRRRFTDPPPARVHLRCAGAWAPIVALAALCLPPSLLAPCRAAAQGNERERSSLATGERVYRLHCAECHGISGDGWGERHDTTYARPRSFLSARFKFATTENGVPSDADLLRTLRHGLPGTGMPNWGWLSDNELEAVAAYVRHLGTTGLRETLAAEVAAGELSAADAEAILARRTEPGPPVTVPAEPTPTPERRRRGARIYREACAPCHGVDGDPRSGDLDVLKTDFEGNRMLPTSFAKGVFKGGSDGPLLYVRVLEGIPGTAMPAFEGAYDAGEVWDVVHYVQSLASAGPIPAASEEAVGPGTSEDDGTRAVPDAPATRSLTLPVGIVAAAVVLAALLAGIRATRRRRP
jgi:mono/diheme cytochrome c family protein